MVHIVVIGLMSSAAPSHGAITLGRVVSTARVAVKRALDNHPGSQSRFVTELGMAKDLATFVLSDQGNNGWRNKLSKEAFSGRPAAARRVYPGYELDSEGVFLEEELRIHVRRILEDDHRVFNVAPEDHVRVGLASIAQSPRSSLQLLVWKVIDEVAREINPDVRVNELDTAHAPPEFWRGPLGSPLPKPMRREATFHFANAEVTRADFDFLDRVLAIDEQPYWALATQMYAAGELFVQPPNRGLLHWATRPINVRTATDIKRRLEKAIGADRAAATDYDRRVLTLKRLMIERAQAGICGADDGPLASSPVLVPAGPRGPGPAAAAVAIEVPVQREKVKYFDGADRGK